MNTNSLCHVIVFSLNGNLCLSTQKSAVVNTSEAQHAYQCDVWLTELADKAVILDTLVTFHAKNTTVIHIQELFISSLAKYEKECISSGGIRMDSRTDIQ
jgi:hypothetical protein